MDDQQVKKQHMTDEERQQLADKLDKELDDYINSLEKKPYSDGWPEDRWEEEMEKHPFFMTKSPVEGEELSPLMEGIQQLKYDESENTPEELAATYKEDGNFNFKYKKYRVAVISYTEGLKQNCKDSELNAQLYNNRAAAHFFLKNYRSCLKDCLAALELKTPYEKAQTRAAQCYFHLNKFSECIALCDDILFLLPSSAEALELRKKAISSKKIQERNLRKESAGQRTADKKEKILLDAIKERGIQINRKGQSIVNLESVEPQSPGSALRRVSLVEGRLVWPVVFLYPEYQISDFIQEFQEDCSFREQLNVMFENAPEWDMEHKYLPNNLHIYFEVQKTTSLCRVPAETSLLKVLQDKRYVVQGGTPAFMVFVAGSDIEKKYVNG